MLCSVHAAQHDNCRTGIPPIDFKVSGLQSCFVIAILGSMNAAKYADHIDSRAHPIG